MKDVSKFKIGDKVTAWRNPIHFKCNVGQPGEVVDVFDSRTPYWYSVKLENGTNYVSERNLTTQN